MKYISHPFCFFCFLLLLPCLALADNLPFNYQLNFQPAATDVMAQITSFHNGLLYLVAGICGFIILLLLIVAIKFSRRANPIPSTTSHNVLLEVIWTTIPVLILIAIAIPSFRLMHKQYAIVDAAFTIKATGYQWYWGYEYPDHEGISFDSVMLEDEERKEGEPRLLAVDNELVVPVGTTIRLQVTAADVIHSWTVPAFGVKMDAVPGRLNETWFRANKTGIYYGQCSELCGIRHAFMPIAVRVVEEQEFETWLVRAKEEFL